MTLKKKYRTIPLYTPKGIHNMSVHNNNKKEINMNKKYNISFGVCFVIVSVFLIVSSLYKNEVEFAVDVAKTFTLDYKAKN